MRPADGRRASSGDQRGGPTSGGASGGGRSQRASAKKMTIASDYTDAREVQRLILDEIERAGFDPDTQFGIKLALEEAIINAIKHGNKLNKQKQVHVEWRVTPQMVEIVIEDEGPGFDRASVPDPTDEVNIEKLTGRGILLIESYMSDVQWSKGGRRVRLVKKNPAGTTRGAKSA